MPWAAFGLFRYAAAAVYVLYSPVFVSSCDFLTLYAEHTLYSLIFCICSIFLFYIFINSPFSHFICTHLRKITDCFKRYYFTYQMQSWKIWR